MNIILEGPDCSGKTTLSKALVGKLRCEYVHLDSKTQHKTYKNVLEHDNEYKVIDRHWPSELVYGLTFRNGPTLNINEMINYCDKKRTLYIVCLPPKELVEKHFNKRLAKEEFNTVDKVYDLYAAITGAWKGFQKYDYTQHTIKEVMQYINSYAN